MFNHTTRSCVFQTGTQVHIQDTGSYSPSSWLYWQLIPDDSQLSLSLSSLVGTAESAFFIPYPFSYPQRFRSQEQVVPTHFPQVSACIPMSLRSWRIVCWKKATESYVGETQNTDLVSIYITGMINTLILPLANCTEYEHFTFLLCVCICMHVSWITYGSPMIICEVRFLL